MTAEPDTHHIGTGGIEAHEDGRRARRDRNRIAVVDAYLELVREGDLHPSVADVAVRSGVSHRSVFRYFADKDDLAQAAVDRQLEWVRSLPPLHIDALTALDDRLQAFIEHRASMHDGVGNVGRLSRGLALRQPIIAEQLERSRSTSRKQVRLAFAAELCRLDPTEANDIVSAIDTVCSFEAYDLLRRSQGLARAHVERIMARTVRRLLSA